MFNVLHLLHTVPDEVVPCWVAQVIGEDERGGYNAPPAEVHAILVLCHTMLEKINYFLWCTTSANQLAGHKLWCPAREARRENLRFWDVREHRESGNTLNSLYLVVAHIWLRIPINYH